MPNLGMLQGGGGRRNGPALRPAESAGRTAGRWFGWRIGRPECRPAVRPAESASRHRRRAEPPEPNRPSRSAAEGTAGSFRPAGEGYITPTFLGIPKRGTKSEVATQILPSWGPRKMAPKN